MSHLLTATAEFPLPAAMVDRANSCETQPIDRPPAATLGAAYLLLPLAFEDIYGSSVRGALAARVRMDEALISPEIYHGSSISWPEVEVLFSGWGMVPMDEAFFRRFPNLKAVFYAAGTVRAFVTPAFWSRGIRLTNAGAANAVPVAEFALAQILFSLKHGWPKALYIRRHKKFPPGFHPPGAYGTTVGLLSLGEIGRMVAERLQAFDLHVVAYDPYVSPKVATARGVRLVSLEEVFAISDVVSCHTPLLPGTEGMIRGAHFAAMKRGATFLNTARGGIVAEEEMITALRKRDDLFAVLDVTQAGEPEAGSPLYDLENVLLTPHIAGSLGRECNRMGQLMVEELDRFLNHEPLRHEIDRLLFDRMA